MPTAHDPWAEGGIRPSVRCYVEDCDRPGYHPSTLQVLVPNSRVIREVHVVLCPTHDRIAKVPGARLRLARHPDDGPPDMTQVGL